MRKEVLLYPVIFKENNDDGHDITVTSSNIPGIETAPSARTKRTAHP
ncbi:hypothetical protein [Lacticaseibacillus mingshuiensis]|uniref:Uncharacterized protein n=1 Tax=Lacticaseibacillus mingshuiensis TaxID=2799574 RepID=A0ABW4CFS5_9LACO|nr:hypothetical protein [Lacticaseibacillus mingshuiensis]